MENALRAGVMQCGKMFITSGAVSPLFLKLNMRIRKWAAGGERENRDPSLLGLTFQKCDTAMMTLGKIFKDPLVCFSLTIFKEDSDETVVIEKGIDPLLPNSSSIAAAP